MVRRSSFGSPVEPCLMSRSGTCQLKEPFWPCRRRVRGLTAVGAGQVLAENVARESGSASLAQGGLPTRKRKLRKVCAPESSPKTLQVVSLPEVCPTPSIEALRMVLGVACGAWSVGNQAMFLAGLGRFSGVYDHWSDQKFSGCHYPCQL